MALLATSQGLLDDPAPSPSRSDRFKIFTNNECAALMVSRVSCTLASILHVNQYPNMRRCLFQFKLFIKNDFGQTGRRPYG